MVAARPPDEEGHALELPLGQAGLRDQGIQGIGRYCRQAVFPLRALALCDGKAEKGDAALCAVLAHWLVCPEANDTVAGHAVGEAAPHINIPLLSTLED